MGSPKNSALALAVAALVFCGLAVTGRASDEEGETPSQEVTVQEGCSFRANPQEFLQSQSRLQQAIFEGAQRSSKYGRYAVADSGARPLAAVPASSVRRHNFIDVEVLGKLERLRVPAAPLSSDEEFFRRIHLDLTGRIPSAADIRAFVGENNPKKREELIDRLLGTPEFNDKWGVWFMDLIGLTENAVSSARDPQIEGRNQFNLWIREQIRTQRPIKDIAAQLVSAKGNNYDVEYPEANFPVLATAPMGPVQDTYDMMLFRSATAFLGMGHYDCLLCHNGRGHLDQISLWGQQSTRSQAQRMAAHFSRMRLTSPAGVRQYESPYFNSTVVSDAATGTYDLNTTAGNRPVRCSPDKIQGTRCTSFTSLTPEYRDGSVPDTGASWRAAFAAKLVADPMFARNFSNRIWKAFFNLGLVDPVDTLDPDRLDPKNPPPAPWELQATHPELLERLAEFFVANNTDLRALVRLIVMSSAYQMSSQYGAEWKLEYVPLFARHYPRRLDAEEIHDAIAKATGVFSNYTWPIINAQTVAIGTALPQSEPVQWAMQLPDINEPRANTGNARTFMGAFGRGNRDTTPRTRSGSILQQLTIMNDNFVTSRTRVATSPLLQQISREADNRLAVEELYLSFLSRLPTRDESEKSVQYLAQSANASQRNTYIEDLAWALINKVEFLFSY
ncbi:MAG TPA: DUF1553 domain-containing protein [Bryobacteraceae bacterium]|nr:DUF1553 domain-containing protein [Bryobacteraceae bacterium]